MMHTNPQGLTAAASSTTLLAGAALSVPSGLRGCAAQRLRDTSLARLATTRAHHRESGQVAVVAGGNVSCIPLAAAEEGCSKAVRARGLVTSPPPDVLSGLRGLARKRRFESAPPFGRLHGGRSCTTETLSPHHLSPPGLRRLLNGTSTILAHGRREAGAR
jgi:hypothetical protein